MGKTRRGNKPPRPPHFNPTDFAVVANFDGSCYPNPGGIAKFAWVLADGSGQELAVGDGTADPIHPWTNNTAEFSGMLAAIYAATNLAKGRPILVQGDSQLAIHAMQKGWKMGKSPHLAKLATLCRFAVKRYTGRIEFQWVPRGKNRRADDLASFNMTMADDYSI